jgi:hypothetical protein
VISNFGKLSKVSSSSSSSSSSAQLGGARWHETSNPKIWLEEVKTTLRMI